MLRKTATPKIMTNWPPKLYRDNTKQHVFVPTLNDRTYFAVRECIDRKLFSLQEIADKSGVKKGWLRMYALGRIPDPSVSRIERLYFFLTSNRL